MCRIRSSNEVFCKNCCPTINNHPNQTTTTMMVVVNEPLAPVVLEPTVLEPTVLESSTDESTVPTVETTENIKTARLNLHRDRIFNFFAGLVSIIMIFGMMLFTGQLVVGILVIPTLATMAYHFANLRFDPPFGGHETKRNKTQKKD